MLPRKTTLLVTPSPCQYKVYLIQKSSALTLDKYTTIDPTGLRGKKTTLAHPVGWCGKRIFSQNLRGNPQSKAIPYAR